MNQADVTKLMSKLRFAVKPRRHFRNPKGPEGRLERMRETVAGLIKYERLELLYHQADEARGYAERLISDAIRYGDTHKATMEMADYWIPEKQYVHKLFKVLVPRLRDCPISYTRMYKAPQPQPIPERVGYRERAVLELRGHPYPSLDGDKSKNRYLIQNVLLDEAKKQFRKKKYAELHEKLGEKQASKASTDQVNKETEKVLEENVETTTKSDEVKHDNVDNEKKK